LLFHVSGIHGWKLGADFSKTVTGRKSKKTRDFMEKRGKRISGGSSGACPKEASLKNPLEKTMDPVCLCPCSGLSIQGRCGSPDAQPCPRADDPPVTKVTAAALIRIR